CVFIGSLKRVSRPSNCASANSRTSHGANRPNPSRIHAISISAITLLATKKVRHSPESLRKLIEICGQTGHQAQIRKLGGGDGTRGRQTAVRLLGHENCGIQVRLKFELSDGIVRLPYPMQRRGRKQAGMFSFWPTSARERARDSY